MRELKRIERITDLIAKVWKIHPDMRLGQLLENFVFVDGERGDKTSMCLYLQEDELTENHLTVTYDSHK